MSTPRQASSRRQSPLLSRSRQATPRLAGSESPSRRATGGAPGTPGEVHHYHASPPKSARSTGSRLSNRISHHEFEKMASTRGSISEATAAALSPPARPENYSGVAREKVGSDRDVGAGESLWIDLPIRRPPPRSPVRGASLEVGSPTFAPQLASPLAGEAPPPKVTVQGSGKGSGKISQHARRPHGRPAQPRAADQTLVVTDHFQVFDILPGHNSGKERSVCLVLAAPPEQQQHVSPRSTSPVSPRRKHATSTRHESPPREESHGLGNLERGGTMTVTFGPKKEYDTLMALLDLREKGVFDEETCEYILEAEDQQTERVDEEGAEGASHAIRPWYLGDGDQTHTHSFPVESPRPRWSTAASKRLSTSSSVPVGDEFEASRYGLVSAKGDRKSTALVSRIRKTADLRHIEGVDHLSETMAAKDLAWSEVRGTSLLQAAVRRTLKHLIWCELKPWCSKAPVHPSERLRMKTFVDQDECIRGDYSYNMPVYAVVASHGPYMWRCNVCKYTRLCRRCEKPGDVGVPAARRFRRLHEQKEGSPVKTKVAHDDELNKLLRLSGVAKEDVLWPRKAAAVIQCAWRCREARKVADVLKETYILELRKAAVVKIGYAWVTRRARLQIMQRRALKVMRAWIETKVVLMQRMARGLMARRFFRVEIDWSRRRKAAPVIQAAARCAIASRVLARWREVKKKPGVKPWELPDPTRRKLVEQPLAIHAVYPHPGKTYPRNAKYGSHNCPGVVSDMGDNYLLVAALNTTLEQSMEIESICSPVHPAFRRKNQAADLDMLWAGPFVPPKSGTPPLGSSRSPTSRPFTGRGGQKYFRERDAQVGPPNQSIHGTPPQNQEAGDYLKDGTVLADQAGGGGGAGGRKADPLNRSVDDREMQMTLERKLQAHLDKVTFHDKKKRAWQHHNNSVNGSVLLPLVEEATRATSAVRPFDPNSSHLSSTRWQEGRSRGGWSTARGDLEAGSGSSSRIPSRLSDRSEDRPEVATKSLERMGALVHRQVRHMFRTMGASAYDSPDQFAQQTLAKRERARLASERRAKALGLVGGGSSNSGWSSSRSRYESTSGGMSPSSELSQA